MPKDKILLTTLYLALRIKPLTILAGPAQSGKHELVENLIQTLSAQKQNNLYFQVLTGHPWWAKGDNIAGLVEVQSRLTSEVAMQVFEEARSPKNCNKAFLVCFTRISPSELQNFFTDLAFQIQNNRIMRLGDMHFDSPFTFPSNLFIVGTMDTDDYRWWDAALLSKTSVIQVGKYNLPHNITPDKAALINVRELMSSIRETNMACKRLKSLLAGEKQTFAHFFQIQEIMDRHNIPVPANLMEDVVIYLANAWSSSGEGLFSIADPHTNFEIATDILIAQLLLPRIQDALQTSSGFRQEMLRVLQLYYPSSFAYLSQFP